MTQTNLLANTFQSLACKIPSMSVYSYEASLKNIYQFNPNFTRILLWCHKQLDQCKICIPLALTGVNQSRKERFIPLLCSFNKITQRTVWTKNSNKICKKPRKYQSIIAIRDWHEDTRWHQTFKAPNETTTWLLHHPLWQT